MAISVSVRMEKSRRYSRHVAKDIYRWIDIDIDMSRYRYSLKLAARSEGER